MSRPEMPSATGFRTPPPDHPDGPTLGAYYDGALGAVAARDVDSHVAGCILCAAHLAELEALAAALRRTEAMPAPAGLLPGVLAALTPAPGPAQVAWLALAQLFVAVAVASVALPAFLRGAGPAWRTTIAPALQDAAGIVSAQTAAAVSALDGAAAALGNAVAAARAAVPGFGGAPGGPWSDLATVVNPVTWIGLLLAAATLWIVVHGAVPAAPVPTGAPNGDRP